MTRRHRHFQRRPGGTIVVSTRITLELGRDDGLIAALEAAPPGRVATLIAQFMRRGASEPSELPKPDKPHSAASKPRPNGSDGKQRRCPNPCSTRRTV